MFYLFVFFKLLKECETRSVTPTSDLQDKMVDIDENFAAVGIKTKSFTTTTTTTTRTRQQRVNTAPKRA